MVVFLRLMACTDILSLEVELERTYLNWMPSFVPNFGVVLHTFVIFTLCSVSCL